MVWIVSAVLGDVLGCANLSGIAGWYSQAGTPHLDVSTSFNAGAVTAVMMIRVTVGNGVGCIGQPGV